jgi:hypothetical protein
MDMDFASGIVFATAVYLMLSGQIFCGMLLLIAACSL